MSLTIFISYSSRNRPLIETLAADLEGLGYTPWFDRELTGGREWWADICQQIRTCDILLFALTNESLDSGPCKLEYTYAAALHKRILPVMVAPINVTVLPTALSKLQFVDYREQSKAQTLALGKALRALPEAEPLPNPLPPEPGAPLSPLAKLRDQIEAATLSADDQTLILARIEELDVDPSISKASLRELLDLMRKRDDLLAKTEKRITVLLERIAPTGAIPLVFTPEPSDPLPIFKGHEGTVTSIAYLPNGRYVLTGSTDRSVRLWEVASGRELRKITARENVICLAVSQDGKRVYVHAPIEQQDVIDSTDEGIAYYSQRVIENVSSAAFTPDGENVFLGSFDQSAYLYHLPTRTQTRVFSADSSDEIYSVAVSPDGRFALTGGKDTLGWLWEVATGKPVRQFRGHTREITSVAFSPDGSAVLTGSYDGTAILWRTANGLATRKFEHGGLVYGVAFSPDGKFILTGGTDNTAKLWDVSNELIANTFEHDDFVNGVAFSPDGKFILTGSGDWTARLWYTGLG